MTRGWASRPSAAPKTRAAMITAAIASMSRPNVSSLERFFAGAAAAASTVAGRVAWTVSEPTEPVSAVPLFAMARSMVAAAPALHVTVPWRRPAVASRLPPTLPVPAIETYRPDCVRVKLLPRHVEAVPVYVPAMSGGAWSPWPIVMETVAAAASTAPTAT